MGTVVIKKFAENHNKNLEENKIKSKFKLLTDIKKHIQETHKRILIFHKDGQKLLCLVMMFTVL